MWTEGIIIRVSNTLKGELNILENTLICLFAEEKTGCLVCLLNIKLWKTAVSLIMKNLVSVIFTHL